MNHFAFLSGFKTVVAGLGMIGFGAYQLSQGDFDSGSQRILEGLAIIGIGHKIDKTVK